MGDLEERIRDRSIRLFTYLRELAGLRSRPTYTLDRYEKVIWFSDIPKQTGCYCVVWEPDKEAEPSEVWIEIRKPPALKPPPKPPDKLQPWLNAQQAQDSSLEAPDLLESIEIDTEQGEREEGSEPATVTLELRKQSDVEEIEALWVTYVDDKWVPWAKLDRPRRKAQAVYNDLFAIYQRQQRLGESYEVVVGAGLLTWDPEKSPRIKRHLVTARTTLEFDAPSATIRVRAAAEGAAPKLEQDMVSEENWPPPRESREIESRVKEIGDDLWSSGELVGSLKAWVHAASEEGEFDETLTPQEGAGLAPLVHLAPAVILRSRAARDLMRTYDEIAGQIEEEGYVPIGVKQLVASAEELDGQAERAPREAEGADGARDEPQEILFPLLANDEQRSVAQQLATQQGVVVQGPPGTGKSHTICNLICHLLATGNRVLVTSHTARALKVLQSKIPPQVSALCVQLLGNDADAMDSLKGSVQGITTRSKSWKPDENSAEISALERERHEARKSEASSMTRLREIREVETYYHALDFGGYRGTAEAIARLLRAEEAEYDWLEDEILEDQEPPLSDDEALELLQLLRDTDAEKEGELNLRACPAADLPGPQRFAAFVAEESKAREEYERASQSREHPSYRALSSCPTSVRQELIDALADLSKERDDLNRHPDPWVQVATAEVLAGQAGKWEHLLNVTREHLETLRTIPSQVPECRGLDTLDRTVARSSAEILLGRLEGGRHLGWWIFQSQPVRRARRTLRDVRIDGQICSTLEPTRRLLNHVDALERLEALQREWSGHVTPPTGSVASQAAAYGDIWGILRRALSLCGHLSRVRAAMADIGRLSEPRWYDTDEVRGFQEAAESVSLREKLDEAGQMVTESGSPLSQLIDGDNVHPAVNQAFSAVRKRDVAGYEEAFKQLAELERLRLTVMRRDALLRRLCAAGSKLSRDPAGSVWCERLAKFSAAWNWVRADSWLKHLTDPQETVLVSRALTRQRERIHELVGKIAAARAWQHCCERITRSQQKALINWEKAVRNIGKGTGKGASLHRRAARRYMEEASPAIPAWIMPIYRVAELIQPKPNLFDVVIVDEASQSGPEALFLQYLGKKLVVVGDDQQIMPQYFVKLGAVQDLQKKYIGDLPQRYPLGINHCLFDLAHIQYGTLTRLKEHFRCMPEIIAFSSRLCYSSDPLVPLRQYGEDRLEPIVVRHVRGGYQEGSTRNTVNRAEAEAVAQQITACCSNPAYDRKTMGVISLLGEAQAGLIERTLLETMGAEKMEGRALVCGDAYAFQGDERDIMFLSMVSAPTEGRRIGTLGSPADKRRFNVAASRAKDQLWLFHSATLSDLSEKCVRHSLLSYCLAPGAAETTSEVIDFKELSTQANSAYRDKEPAPRPFDSWFEVDVCLELRKRGYSVRPQFEVIGYYIDLVVIGPRTRLAVECDGEKGHGLEDYDKDTWRQRQLERCDWTFWRIRASEFYRDPQSALRDLWEELDRLGIHPGAAASPRAQVTPKRERPQPPSECPAEIATASPSGRGKAVIPPGDFKLRTEPETIQPKLFGVVESRREKRSAEDDNTAPSEEPYSSPGRDATPRLQLPAYEAWEPRPMPDPRTARRSEVADGLVEIVSVEGPITCQRLYSVYARSAGINRVGRQIRSLLNKALYGAVGGRKLQQRDESSKRSLSERIVWTVGTPAVTIRVRGPRTLQEIPLSEIGALMGSIVGKGQESSDKDSLFRRVIGGYELRNMTDRARERLELAFAMLKENRGTGGTST